MNTLPRLICATLLVAASMASIGPREHIGFAPEEGSRLTKSFAMEGLMELDDLSAIVNGLDMTEMIPLPEISIDLSSRIVVTDTYQSMSKSRPKVLKRAFDSLMAASTLSADSDLGNEEQEARLSSPLEGRTVLFTLDEDGESYEASFLGGDGDSDLLELLEEEMDLRFLLPGKEVSEGDRWGVPVKLFAHLVKPGGDLAWSVQEIDEVEGLSDVLDGVGESLTSELEDLLDGECVCTFKGTADGIASIEIELEIGSAIDIIETLESAIEQAGEESGEEVPIELEIADLNFDLEAHGLLLWDVVAGHAKSFEISSDGLIGLDLAISSEAMGETASIEVAAEVSTSMKHTVEIE